MALQENAIFIIDTIAKKIEGLLYRHGFDKKIRTSDESIFAEKLFYQHEKFELEVVACVHPHDYPYSLSVRFVNKIPYNYEYIDLLDLIRLLGKKHISKEYALLIATDQQIESTITLVYELLQYILEENLLQQWSKILSKK
jgi:hypothetical protein